MTTIVNNAHAGRTVTDPMTAPLWNPCASSTPPMASAMYGTSGSATVAIYSKDFQVKNITIANDFDETGMTNNLQAVALMTQADKLVFENVRVLGNQDTLYVKTGNVDTVARAYFKKCAVDGDVDFIFGRGTFVLDDCTIRLVTNRRTSGNVLAPSTDTRNPYGILIINSRLTGDAGAAAGSLALGRAWDEGASGGYPPAGAASYPNGQALVRESVLDAKVNTTTPWAAAATTSRPFSATSTAMYPANRLWEYSNAIAVAAP
jgi:pectinesterase